MPAYLPLLLSLGLILGQANDSDLGQLQEMLHDRQDQRAQSQAALLLLQHTSSAAEKIARQVLHLAESEDVFLALAGAVRIRRDSRFTDELYHHLASTRPRIRQAAAETLTALADAALVRRLEETMVDVKAEVRLRQAAIWTLGRTSRQDAAGALVNALGMDNEDLRRIVAASLADLTGLNHGTEVARWKAWWATQKQLPAADWLHQRLTYQTARASRLDGELLRSRAQVLRLHQQVYTRLSVSERLGYVQALLDQEEPGVRGLAVIWCVELLSSPDADRQAAVGKILVKLTHDPNPEVQRGAVLALGRLTDNESFDLLTKLVQSPASPVRAAAIRALSLQARSGTPDARKRLKPIVPALQKALEDRSLDVVVEAAETLGTLGVPEAGPVLTGLLRHPSEQIRQTAAQALERIAEPKVIDGLLRGLDDTSITVRFSLLSAVGRAAGNGQTLTADVRKRVITRLEAVLRQDTDPGVRGRAATVLGECGDHECLPGLWQHVLAGDGRVQEKAWDALVEIIIRAGSVPLVDRWDRTMSAAKQASRRLQLWGRVYTRWEQSGTQQEAAFRALEGLIAIQLEMGKWASAGPLVQGLLAKASDLPEATKARCLRWAADAAEQAIREGNRAEALRLLKEARPALPAGDKLTEEYNRLEKLAGAKP